MPKSFCLVASIVATATLAAGAQTPARDALEKGKALWDQRLGKSAFAALAIAAKDTSTAAEANEVLGRIYTFKGWQQESVFPSWHDEPAYREKALAALRASVAADPSRVSAQEALKIAEGFAAAEKVDPAPARPEIKALDAKLDALRASGTADDVAAALEARTRAQADPQPYFTATQILIDKGAYDRAIATAAAGVKASDRFIDENFSAYQMDGKAQGAGQRAYATAADLTGWALFLKKDIAGATAKLEEASRLGQGQDLNNELHLAELARSKNDVESARNHYLSALSLGGMSGGPAPLRERATQALAAIHGDAGFQAWLDGELAKRRDDRMAAALKSLVDKPLPKLTLTTVDGKPFDMAAFKGKVVLLDFFASWCGICRAELPLLKTAYAKYQNDPGVAFVIVSIDTDAKRLQRYLNDMKFPFPVARGAQAHVEQTMGIDNVPSTFYVDRSGVVRYQVVGNESHGDSINRVGWFIDQLKTR